LARKVTSTGKTRIAIYPGTFDPVTNGHLSLIERATQLFDELIVAVAKSAGKDLLLHYEDRITLLSKSIEGKPYASQVRVQGFDGLLAHFAIRMKAAAIIRGLRAVSDFEYEFQMALMNRKLARDVETVFLMPALSWVYLSSTIVKDVAGHDGDVSGLVPPPVTDAIKRELALKG